MRPPDRPLLGWTVFGPLSSTEMTHGLTHRELAQWPVVPISEEDFRGLQRAKAGLLAVCLLAVLNIEHKFAILLSYKEYELELVGISIGLRRPLVRASSRALSC